MNIEWSPEAIEDLNSLRAFIAQDNPSAARILVLREIADIESASLHRLRFAELTAATHRDFQDEARPVVSNRA